MSGSRTYATGRPSGASSLAAGVEEDEPLHLGGVKELVADVEHDLAREFRMRPEEPVGERDAGVDLGIRAATRPRRRRAPAPAG